MSVTESDIYAAALGKLVAEIRSSKGLTQQELADRLGVAQSTISRIEKGQVTPNAYLLRQIASALGMEVGDLSRMVDEVLERSSRAARGAGLSSADPGVPWWKIAVGVAGFSGVLGLVAYAVGTALHEWGKSRNRSE
ncbi:MAG: helix-turn-helix transcriptional regulator [Bradymonadales bacterium]|nr:helix-turn-helix transcriptional regulator [Bradymonadales bacterium]